MEKRLALKMSEAKYIYNTNTINILVKDSKKRKNNEKFPKSILVLFLSSQLLFGINFGFSSIFKKKYQLIVERCSVFLSIAMTVLIISPLLFNSIFYWFHVIEYTAYILLLKFTKYNAYHFINDINKIYDLNRSNKTFLSFVGVYYNIAEFFMKAIFISILYKIGTEVIFSTNLSQYGISYTIIYHVPSIGLDVVSIVQIVLMYYINCCVRHLKTLLIANDVNFRYIEKYYVNIANCFDNIKPLYGRIVSYFFVYVILIIFIFSLQRHYMYLRKGVHTRKPA